MEGISKPEDEAKAVRDWPPWEKRTQGGETARNTVGKRTHCALESQKMKRQTTESGHYLKSIKAGTVPGPMNGSPPPVEEANESQARFKEKRGVRQIGT